MVWQWRFEGGAPGGAAEPEADAFTNQSDAESWLGEHWRELAAAGVTAVHLYEDEVRVYGPLGLTGLE